MSPSCLENARRPHGALAPCPEVNLPGSDVYVLVFANIVTLDDSFNFSLLRRVGDGQHDWAFLLVQASYVPR